MEQQNWGGPELDGKHSKNMLFCNPSKIEWHFYRHTFWRQSDCALSALNPNKLGPRAFYILQPSELSLPCHVIRLGGALAGLGRGFTGGWLWVDGSGLR